MKNICTVLLATLVFTACAPDAAPVRDSLADTNSDSAFVAVQHRGHVVMGVDQYTSQHVFEALPDGGRIVLERDDATDSASIATIRQHMRDIQLDFTNGDFSKPFGVHAQEVPGTRVLAERRDVIRYEVESLPRGAALRIYTTDSAALGAIGEFMAFQRMDHRAHH